jgi:cystathionine gamma-synthase
LNGSYVNNLFIDDAVQLEYNSRDFLTRAATVNDTAEYLVDFLQPLVSDPNSVVSRVYYPKVCWSKENYHKRMRPATEEFVPGYGGLFTIEFDTVASGSAFLDALDVHKGPSLGAHITLAQPYVQMVLQKKKEWAARHGLSETIIRISVGLENKEMLLNKIQTALLAAEKTRSRS